VARVTPRIRRAGYAAAFSRDTAFAGQVVAGSTRRLALLGAAFRIAVSRKSGKHEGLLNGEFDRLVRYDAETGESVHYDGDLVHGEVVHAARAGASVGRGDVELDGWYLTYATDLAARSSTSSSGTRRPGRPSRWPRSEGPHRVPNGLHGSWMPTEP
jgi:carotenoid cleavage dioxygenase-like enzyme